MTGGKQRPLDDLPVAATAHRADMAKWNIIPATFSHDSCLHQLFPRTSPQIVAELRILLQHAQYVGPFLLVGHSFGGLTMHCYALQHPQEVAGLLIIDPPSQTSSLNSVRC